MPCPNPAIELSDYNFAVTQINQLYRTVHCTTVNRDHGGLGFFVPEYHPKISLIFT